MDNKAVLFEGTKIRRVWDKDRWWFSIVDVVEVLSQSTNPRDYWYKMKVRVKEEGFELSTICRQLKLESSDGKLYETDCADAEGVLRIIQSIPSSYWKTHGVKEGDEFALLTNVIHHEWTGLTVNQHKKIKKLKSENLRDHMSEAELIFTALAEYSTRQIAQKDKAEGLPKNITASKKGGNVAKKARLDLESRTGEKVVTGENFKPSLKDANKDLQLPS